MAMWLKARREYLGLNQDDLVARLGAEGLSVTRATISAWETGRNNIPFDEPQKVKILGRALRMSVHDILLAAGYPLGDNYSNEAMQAANLIDRLEPNRRRTVLDMLEHFVQAMETHA